MSERDLRHVIEDLRRDWRALQRARQQPPSLFGKERENRMRHLRANIDRLLARLEEMAGANAVVS